ncbi:MAG: DUF362 domain-containing protein, partial [Armatimonadota bacterium]
MSSSERKDKKNPEEAGARDPGPTRRELLKAIAAGTLLAGSGLLGSCGRSGADEASRSARAGGNVLQRDGVVVVVRHRGVVGEKRQVDARAVARMIEVGLTRLTGASDPGEAWRCFFSPSDVIGMKVNCLGAPGTHTHTEVATAAAAGLHAAGVPKRNVIIFDRLTDELDRAGFPVNTGDGFRCFGTDSLGYDRQPTVVREVGSCFSRIVSEECTALLNVPMLKDHDVAGVSISLKNHFGCIHNPNKLHLNGCSPYVADLNLAPQIRRKHRLIICDALEVIYDGGPTYRPSTAEPYGALLIGTDPVALDRVGWQIIEELRARAGLRS